MRAGVLESESYGLSSYGVSEYSNVASPTISYAAPAISGITYGAESPALSAVTKASFIPNPTVYSSPTTYAASVPAISYAAPALSYAAPAITTQLVGNGYHSGPQISYSSIAAPSTYTSAPVVSSAIAAPVAYAAPIGKAYVTENYAPAHYDFEYGVNDPHTGDIKSQRESRRGDVVQGESSV